jgi:hypothetical protein
VSSQCAWQHDGKPVLLMMGASVEHDAEAAGTARVPQWFVPRVFRLLVGCWQASEIGHGKPHNAVEDVPYHPNVPNGQCVLLCNTQTGNQGFMFSLASTARVL